MNSCGAAQGIDDQPGAALHPQINLICIETRRADVELIRARASQRSLSNLLVIHGDAKLLLPRLFREGDLSALHVREFA